MLQFASVCEKGGKEENHDFLGILEEEHCTFFAVADGKALAETSELAIKTMMADFQEESQITTATLPNFFEHAQAAVSELQAESALIGGCSAAVLLTDGSLAVWAHVGDCRIYHLQDNLLYDITTDHSEAYTRYEMGGIRYPKIRTDRGRTKLFRMMGLEQNFEPTFSKPTMVKENDSFLICSDGFWCNIHERQIEKTLKRSKDAQDWLNRMLTIVKKNRETGKYTRILDDYSAVTIQI